VIERHQDHDLIVRATGIFFVRVARITSAVFIPPNVRYIFIVIMAGAAQRDFEIAPRSWIATCAGNNIT